MWMKSFPKTFTYYKQILIILWLDIAHHTVVHREQRDFSITKCGFSVPPNTLILFIDKPIQMKVDLLLNQTIFTSKSCFSILWTVALMKHNCYFIAMGFNGWWIWILYRTRWGSSTTICHSVSQLIPCNYAGCLIINLRLIWNIVHVFSKFSGAFILFWCLTLTNLSSWFSTYSLKLVNQNFWLLQCLDWLSSALTWS